MGAGLRGAVVGAASAAKSRVRSRLKPLLRGWQARARRFILPSLAYASGVQTSRGHVRQARCGRKDGAAIKGNRWCYAPTGQAHQRNSCDYAQPLD